MKEQREESASVRPSEHPSAVLVGLKRGPSLMIVRAARTIKVGWECRGMQVDWYARPCFVFEMVSREERVSRFMMLGGCYNGASILDAQGELSKEVGE